MAMIKLEKLRNDSHYVKRIHMFTILFEIKSGKQIENGKLLIYCFDRLQQDNESDLKISYPKNCPKME